MSTATITTKTEFRGQAKFRKALEREFCYCDTVIEADGFHDGWKRITGIPKEGNFNPNYLDVLRYIEAVQKHSHFNRPCPYFPVEIGLDPGWRDGQSYEQDWMTMLNFCKVYREFVRRGITSPKRSGVIVRLFNDGYIDGKPNVEEMFPYLVSLACSRYEATFRGDDNAG